LGAFLRAFSPNPGESVFSREIPEGTKVKDLAEKLGIPLERVGLVMVNHRGAPLGQILAEGDRVAFFPPELAFNMYVALYFRKREGSGD